MSGISSVLVSEHWVLTTKKLNKLSRELSDNSQGYLSRKFFEVSINTYSCDIEFLKIQSDVCVSSLRLSLLIPINC